jgi:hypothetical protein
MNGREAKQAFRKRKGKAPCVASVYITICWQLHSLPNVSISLRVSVTICSAWTAWLYHRGFLLLSPPADRSCLRVVPIRRSPNGSVRSKSENGVKSMNNCRFHLAKPVQEPIWLFPSVSPFGTPAWPFFIQKALAAPTATRKSWIWQNCSILRA